MFDFQKLEVYQKSLRFYSQCSELTAEKISDEAIKNQLGRAALSVPLNIAEGSAKFSKAYRRNFFDVARASIHETVAIMDVLRSSKVISQDKYNCMECDAAEISKILFVMIRNLENSSKVNAQAT